MKNLLLTLSCVAILSGCGANKAGHDHHHHHDTATTAAAGADTDTRPRVLVFSGTGYYRHPEIAAINGWLVRFGHEHGFVVDVSEHRKELMPPNIDKYDILLLNNANQLDKVIDEKAMKSVEAWYKKGNAIVAIHAALVYQQEFPWLMNLAGCDFNSDSKFHKARVVVDPAAMDHPAVKGWGKEFWYSADWSNHDKSVTGLEGVQVLLRVDESSYSPVVQPYFQTRGGKGMGEDHPIAWTRIWDGGRFFYTEFGHDLRSLDTPFGRQHLLAGMRWVLEDDE